MAGGGVHRRSAWSRVAGAALLVLAGCSTGDSVISPRATDAPCVGGASLQLAPLGVANLDCASGTTATLAGGGATYLVAALLAGGEVSADPVTYTIAVPSDAVSALLPVAATVAPTTPRGPRTGRGRAAAAFDAALRARGEELARGGRETIAPVAPGVAAPGLRPAGAAAPLASDSPALGSLRTFQVLSNLTSNRYTPITARLAYAGSNVLLYVDQAAPPGGFTDVDLEGFGRYYDEVLYPLDVSTFGPPSDIDGNGRLVMLLTPVVNALVTAAQCAREGYVGGFFNPVDLSGGAGTNRGEVFYAIVPDPTGSVSCEHGVAATRALLGTTFLHELQHLISYSQHVLLHRGKANAGWLDEGLSLVAEELGSIYYEAKYPAPLGRSSPGQLLPDSALPFLENVIPSSYGYLGETDTVSLTTHSDDDPGVGWRGGDWLLLRWLGDHKGGVSFFRAVGQSALTGIADTEAAAGESFPTLFGDFALALYTDSLPGIARSAIPLRNTFVTRALRPTLAAAGASAYPLEPAALTGAATGTLVSGAVALYRIHSTTTSATLTLRFSTPAGAPLPAARHPRLSIMRLP